jgi:fumarate hydratase class II
MLATGTRLERDSMGELEVPAFAMFGATTQRARLNFPISKLRRVWPCAVASAACCGAGGMRGARGAARAR